MRRVLPLLLLLTLCGAVWAQETLPQPAPCAPTDGAVWTAPNPQFAPELAKGKHYDLVTVQCTSCHSAAYITMQPPMPTAAWAGIVTKMVDTYGAPIDPARQAKIVEYLSQHYTPETIKRAPVPAVGPPPIPLPPGSGSRLYGQNCGGCHQDDGSGSQAFYPPLKTHAANLLKVPGGCTYLAYVVLFGLGGQFQLNGQTYAGAMPPMGSQLSDNEIAAILNFVATAWGNDKRLPKGFRKYTATEIGVARQAGLSASDVMIERAKMSIQH